MNKMKLKDIGEIGLIKRLSKRIRLDKTVIRGVGEDTAVIKWTPEKYLLFTCDMLIEGVHFKLREASPFRIGWKAIGRNLSDIAAMGGVPKYALISIGLNPEYSVSFVDGIYEGMRALANSFKVNIVGGDTARSKKLVIDISMIGEVEKRRLVTRCGAKKGDLIFVTGTLGGSLKGKHLNFTPRLKEARQLVKGFRINSMIDVSDGLVLDLWRVLDESKLGGRIYESLIPVSKEALSFEKAISDGEDFELLFTMSASEAKRFFKRTFAKLDVPVTLIGEVMDRRYGYKLIREDGKVTALKERRKGYLHF